jgi:undecaprenol kinase
MKTLLHSFKCASSGIITTLVRERNFKIEIAVFAVAVIAGILLKITKTELLFILLISSILFALEMINTALELTLDLVLKEYKVLIRRIKDIAAGAVLLVSLIAFIMGLIIFIPYFVNLFDK